MRYLAQAFWAWLVDWFHDRLADLRSRNTGDK